MNENRCVAAEDLTQSAQQAQRKESTKSYKETSRKYELSEIEEKESPLECIADKQTSKLDKVSSYHDTLHNTAVKVPNPNSI